MAKTVRFFTLGCKVNQYDSEAMLERFLENGYISAKQGAPADVYVVNTCIVTGEGQRKSMQAVRRFGRLNPGGELIIAGCLAQNKGEALLETGARLILGTQRRGEVVKLFEQAIMENARIVAVESLSRAAFEPLNISGHLGHTRALMKIQEGCDNRCTYCIVPVVRGGIRSRTLDDIRGEARALAEAGFKEIVLTGVHLTSYGRDQKDKPSLADAVAAVAETGGIERIRLGSLEPPVVTDAFADTMRAIPRLCPQFHLALQSGSDEVLCRMKRRYNTAQFLSAAEKLQSAFPDAALTTDVIVGFPGETEEEFSQTLAFCQTVGFMKIHVFPFSPRPGTPAADMPVQLPKHVKDERVRRLLAVGGRLSAAYRKRLLHTVQPVLIEEKRRGGAYAGFTPQYVQVICEGGNIGEILPVRLSELTKEGMRGELVNTIDIRR
ncbi:MAG: tRNA (N(6)-L-threonylcarbamoyladenosine(37)-C(2))-methylthiotransferase MtaB [Clostridiales bacterium]|nr:tRNA (N(6)-L-threonylcarbamoyladenosine(37)-C(2))-methylthiotransferase MtaB [Clostridiales bacterium]